mgnify:CR=1 FL=1
MSSDGSTYTRLCKSKQDTERRFIAGGKHSLSEEEMRSCMDSEHLVSS